MKKATNKIGLTFFCLASCLFLLIFCFIAAANKPTSFVYSQSECGGKEYDILKAAVGADLCENYICINTTNTVFGKIMRFQQTNNGKAVEGAQITVTVDTNDDVLSWDGRYIDIPRFKAPAVTVDKAIEIVHCKENCDILSVQDVYFYNGANVFDVYKLSTLNLKTYYVCKHTGEIVYSSISSSVVKTNEDAFGKDIDIDVAAENGKFFLKDEDRKIYISDAKGEDYKNYYTLPESLFSKNIYTSGTGEDFAPLAVTVFDNLIKTYDFYTDEKNTGSSRFGITDANDNADPNDDYKLYVFLNFASNDPYSDANNNAFFTYVNSKFGYICIGNGTQSEVGGLYQQGKAMDVLAHEYQHGVTNETAGLQYTGESGALDEAFSDIFGSLIEGNDPSDLNSSFWTIGENGVHNPFGASNLAIRSLKGGTNKQKYKMSEKFTCTDIAHTKFGRHDNSCDNNGVHINSTIISHIQYELSSLEPQFFTKERIGTLWFTTLLKLAPTSNFIDFANAFVNSAIELGYKKDILTSVSLALSNAGIYPDAYYTVTFVNAEDDSIIEYEYITKIKNYLDYESIKHIIERDIVTPNFTYKFNKLQKDKDGADFDITIFSSITEDLTIYVDYNIYCTATFLDIEGQLLSSEEYVYGSQIIPYDYTSLNEAKYNFYGWHEYGKDDDSLFNFKNTTITQNIIFIPLTSIKKYTVCLYTQTDDGSALITKMILNYGETVHLPDNTTVNAKHDGFILEGWYFDSQFTNRADDLSVTQDINLYAKWIRDDAYFESRINFIILVCLLISFLIFIPIILFITKRRKRY